MDNFKIGMDKLIKVAGTTNLTYIRDNIKQDLDKLNDFSGRRNLIFSLDCISLIQLLVRKDINIFNVYIRSSDCLRLLLVDILAMIKLFKTVLATFGIEGNMRICFTIASCHFYDKDQVVVNNILNKKLRSK